MRAVRSRSGTSRARATPGTSPSARATSTEKQPRARFAAHAKSAAGEARHTYMYEVKSYAMGRMQFPTKQPMPGNVRAALEKRNLMHAYLARPEYQTSDYLKWIALAAGPAA